MVVWQLTHDFKPWAWKIIENPIIISFRLKSVVYYIWKIRYERKIQLHWPYCALKETAQVMQNDHTHTAQGKHPLNQTAWTHASAHLTWLWAALWSVFQNIEVLPLFCLLVLVWWLPYLWLNSSTYWHLVGELGKGKLWGVY